MRLILHIGMPKTGTSTLQVALCEHRHRLAHAGILYPTPLGRRRNHNLLTVLLDDPDHLPREFRARGDRYETVVERAETFWKSVRREVRRSRAELAIMSAEYLFGLPEAAVGQLRSMLDEVFDEVQVACYVRDPASHYVSLMQQLVKASSRVRPPALFHLFIRGRILHYVDAFDGAVTVRSADRSALVGNDIVSDFLTTFVPGGEALVPDVEVVDQNVSMSAEAMCILQALRRYGWPGEDDRFAPESDLALDVLNHMRDEEPQTKPALRPEIRRHILRNHRRHLEFLEREFGISFPLDGVDVGDDEPEPAAVKSTDLREILDVDRGAVERTTFLLVKELARRD
jgi:hypothetical protein